MIAKRLGKYKGKQVSLFTVQVSCNEIVTITLNPDHARKFTVKVVAHNASEALNYVRDLIDWPALTEFHTYGIRGGAQSRFIGYDSFIGCQMFKPVSKQLALDLDN